MTNKRIENINKKSGGQTRWDQPGPVTWDWTVIPGLSNRGEIVLLEFTDKMKNKKEVIPVLLPFIFENLDGIKSQLNRISISSITIDEQSGVLLMSLTITLTSFAETKPNDQFDYDFVLDYAVDPLKRVGYPVGR